MELKKYRNEIGFIILLVLSALLFCHGRSCGLDFGMIQNRLGGVPLLLSGFLFILLYVTITFFVWLAKDAFWLMGVVLFGAFGSSVLILAAEMVNLIILFYLSRRLGRGFLEKNLSGRYKRLDEKLGSINFAWLFVFRAAPLIPYRFLDIAAGLTGIGFGKYFTASLLGSPLKIFWIQYILYGVGSSVFEPAVLMDYFMKNRLLLLVSALYMILIPLVIIKLKSKG